MKITPLSRRRDSGVGVAVVRSGHLLVAGEWGVTPLREAPVSAAIYAHSDTAMMRLIRAGVGRARSWRGDITGWQFGRHRVMSSRGIVEELTAPEALEELRSWATWLRRWGASVGSMAGSGYSLWRATLPGEVAVYLPPQIPWKAVSIGGRQELGVRPGHYLEVAMWDIGAAYPHALTSMGIPRDYREIPGDPGAEPVGFALAEVRFPRPETGFGPLPLRVLDNPEEPTTIYPMSGTETGWWTLSELALARDFGARVTYRRSFVGNGSVRMFGARWWEAVQDGRGMAGPAGLMAKVGTSSLWGSFSTHGRAEWVSYTPAGELLVEPDRRDVWPACPGISALAAARVRERLYREALSAFPVYSAHTDGVILPVGYHLEPNTGGPGRWKERERATWVELVSPQVYRYKPEAGGPIEYVVSGTPARYAPQVFRALAGRITRRRRHKARSAV